MDKKRIIIIDDNPDFCYMVKKGLERLTNDFKVIVLENENECIKLLKKIEKPSLILLDIMMPRMNGGDVFAKIKENRKWRDIPILFVSAKTDHYSKGFGEINAESYIEKPINIEHLKQKN